MASFNQEEFMHALQQFAVQQLAQQHLPNQIHHTQPSLLPRAQEQYLSRLQQHPSRYEQQFSSTDTVRKNQSNPRGSVSFFSEIRKQGNVL